MIMIRCKLTKLIFNCFRRYKKPKEGLLEANLLNGKKDHQVLKGNERQGKYTENIKVELALIPFQFVHIFISATNPKATCIHIYSTFALLRHVHIPYIATCIHVYPTFSLQQ